MKKSYSKPEMDMKILNVENVISVSVADIKAPTKTIQYTKGKLNF